MANFSIRLARRNSMGNVVPGQYVEFETDSGAELADFYDKTVVTSRPGKRHNQVAGKQRVRGGKGKKDDNISLSGSTQS